MACVGLCWVVVCAVCLTTYIQFVLLAYPPSITVGNPRGHGKAEEAETPPARVGANEAEPRHG